MKNNNNNNIKNIENKKIIPKNKQNENSNESKIGYIKKETEYEEPIFIKYQRLKSQKQNQNPPPKKFERKKFKNGNTSISNHILKTNDIISDKTNKMLELNKKDNIKNIKRGFDSRIKIKIDINIMNKNDYELNILPYKEALEIDKRTYTIYYFSLLKINHLLLFPFRKNDYNSFIIKIYLFFFFFTLFFSINTLFFSDSTMHKIYEDEGSFNFIYQIPQIIYSSLISSVINAVIKNLSLSEKNVLQIKKEKLIENIEKNAYNIIRFLNIKFKVFFVVSFLLILFFWYYISCFCAVYKNTQLHLIKDSIISFGLSLLYPLGIYLLPGFFRIPALRNQKKNKELMYKISKAIQLL